MTFNLNRYLHAIVLTVGVLAITLTMSGCSTGLSSQAAVRPEFGNYDRVAIWSNLAREDEETFLPAWMEAFPSQTVVERRDLRAIVSEQDLMPSRLNESTRAKIREVLGVHAIVYPTLMGSSHDVSIKVIDTETGIISASCVIDGSIDFFSGRWNDAKTLRAAVRELARQAAQTASLTYASQRVDPGPVAHSPPAVELRFPTVTGNDQIERIAVLGFEDSGFTELVTDHLVNYSQWRVFDRASLDRIIEEQDLQRSERFDDDTAARIGKLSGVNMVVFGSFEGAKTVLKGIDVETGEYLVFKTVERREREPIGWHAVLVCAYLIPCRVTSSDNVPTAVSFLDYRLGIETTAHTFYRSQFGR